MEIERRSFDIIAAELGDRSFEPEQAPVIYRVIHTTADFDYADNLTFSPGAVQAGLASLLEGCNIVTDTTMAQAGINKRALSRFGGSVRCYIADADVAQEAVARGVTRSQVSMEKAARESSSAIFAIGNAPTALFSICELVRSGALTRRAIVWDVGTGSGSVAVEAARIARDGQVYAIERKPEALEVARRNVEKFSLRNVTLVSGNAPEVLEALPTPTHVFIGGSDGGLKGILSAVLSKNPKARVVANAVTLESVAELAALAKEFEYSEVVQLAVNKSRQAGNHTLMTAQNPVYIFTLQGLRQAEDSRARTVM